MFGTAATHVEGGQTWFHFNMNVFGSLGVCSKSNFDVQN